MPELPEVETTMRALAARLTGAAFTKIEQRRPDLRFPLPDNLPKRLENRQIIGFRRRAKYILIDLSGGQTLVIHLGMSGRLLFDGEFQGKHEHLTFHFDPATTLRFVDPRRFGMLDLMSTSGQPGHAWFAHLGIEPLGNAFSGPELASRLAGCVSPVKTAIMDQRRVVGVGNIYASESLFLAGISPNRKACNVQGRRTEKLADAIRAVLQKAIAAGGSSLRDYVQSNGELGNFQSQFNVYDRAGEACPQCAQPIRRIVQSNRATFYCARCQG